MEVFEKRRMSETCRMFFTNHLRAVTHPVLLYLQKGISFMRMFPLVLANTFLNVELHRVQDRNELA